MGLFGKKKDEEFDEEEGISPEEELQDRRLTRKFRDLNPENKKKRKEPPKPWGKKERIVVGGFFLVTTIVSTLLFLLSHEFKLPGLPKITLKSVNFQNPFGEEIIEIGQKKTAPKNDQKALTATALFNKEIKPLSGFYGFMVIRLTDGTGYGVSTNSTFQGASLLKFPLMVLTYKLSEEGSLSLDTKYTLKDVDKVKGSGVLYTAKAGSVYTYRELVEFMGKDSDRTAYKVMKDVVSDTKFNAFLAEVGMTGTSIDSGNTTPHDIGTLFQKLWQNELVNTEDRDEILNDLTDTIYEKWITAGVPKSVKVAHKFGQDAGVMADGGIVESANPYVLVIMGNGITAHDADLLFPRVSSDVYGVENDVQ